MKSREQSMDRGDAVTLFKFIRRQDLHSLLKTEPGESEELCCHLRSQLEIYVAHNIP